MTALKMRVSYIPRGNGNRPALLMIPAWITVHETGNPKPGMDAEAHRVFCHNGGGDEEVSFHWTVDDHEAIQLLPHDENGWHAGDGYAGTGNRRSIAIEACVNSDGDWAATTANLAELIARIMRQERIALDRVVQHNKWSGKNCPATLRRAGWAALLADVGRRYEALRVPPPDPTDALLEAAWRKARATVGEKRYAADLNRPYHRGKVLVCQRGIVTTTGVLDAVGLIDDVTTYWDDANVMTRWP